MLAQAVMRQPTVADRCRMVLASSQASVFRTLAFQGCGSRAAVQRALVRLMADSLLVRIGVGVYARAKRSSVTGAVIPVKPLEYLAQEALALFGVEAGPSRAVQEYNAGRTTQVPCRTVLNTGTRRVTRKISFNGKGPSYEMDLPKKKAREKRA
jgi:hypothetical protein